MSDLMIFFCIFYLVVSYILFRGALRNSELSDNAIFAAVILWPFILLYYLLCIPKCLWKGIKEIWSTL